MKELTWGGRLLWEYWLSGWVSGMWLLRHPVWPRPASPREQWLLEGRRNFFFLESLQRPREGKGSLGPLFRLVSEDLENKMAWSWYVHCWAEAENHLSAKAFSCGWYRWFRLGHTNHLIDKSPGCSGHRRPLESLCLEAQKQRVQDQSIVRNTDFCVWNARVYSSAGYGSTLSPHALNGASQKAAEIIPDHTPEQRPFTQSLLCF